MSPNRSWVFRRHGAEKRAARASNVQYRGGARAELIDTILNAIQWPAMAATLFAAWLVGSTDAQRRAFGFWCFIASNVLWCVWAWHDRAWALIALQVGLFVLNLRGAHKNEDEATG